MKTFSFDGGTYTLESMLEANAHDEDLCYWLVRAEVGDTYDGDCTRVS